MIFNFADGQGYDEFQQKRPMDLRTFIRLYFLNLVPLVSFCAHSPPDSSLVSLLTDQLMMVTVTY